MDPFLGQIILFGGTFAPRGWAECAGQLLAISSNTALFSILGTTYGGDGRTTFGLPDLRGRVPLGDGQGAGLGAKRLGEKGGTETSTILQANLPAISVSIPVSEEAPDVNDPNGAYLAAGSFYSSAPGDGSLGGARSIGGTSQPMDNHQPYTALKFIICTDGTYPSRN